MNGTLFNFVLPDELKKKLKVKSKQNHRTISAHLIELIKKDVKNVKIEGKDE